ncbi:hypothetical protein MTR_5g044090 [Medicago truncatula]|uniref:Putative plant transposon protein domain-containing protein n=1 Tax=Medicago truncatula TaxID=3880 RepID=G7JWS7_MEDTR|nr:hypothetical protein MTR_5g044090 [Medicago truncatula]
MKVESNEEVNEASDEETISDKGNVSEKTEEEKVDEEVLSKKGKELTEDEDSQETGQTLREMAKKTSEDEQEMETEEEKPVPRKREKGKDIVILASTLRIQNLSKMTSRPLSRAKYFDFKSLKTKRWNLKEFTEPQLWTDFVTLQEHTYENLVREFYTNLSVKKKKNVNEKFLISSAKSVKMEVTQEFLSQVLNIPNEGKIMFSSCWFDEAKVNRNQLIIKYTKENKIFNSTNLEDTPKILHNMIRHTLLPRCGSFDVISDIDMCIIHHLMNKTKLNLCYIIIQHMIDSCLAIKQTVASLPYGMHLTPLFQKAKVPLEGEKRKLDFMTFSSKTLGQLHITTSNMPSSTTSGSSGSVKRPSNQNVLKTRKKRTVEEIIDESPKNVEARPPSPPALELFSQVSKLKREIVKEGSSQFKALIGESLTKDDAEKENNASLQGEAENVKQATEAHEGIPQAADENSVDQDQRVEENTEKDTQNVDEDTQEVAELLASNMLIEEDVQVEHMGFSTGFDLNIEDINTDFNN